MPTIDDTMLAHVEKLQNAKKDNNLVRIKLVQGCVFKPHHNKFSGIMKKDAPSEHDTLGWVTEIYGKPSYVPTPDDLIENRKTLIDLMGYGEKCAGFGQTAPPFVSVPYHLIESIEVYQKRE